MDTGNSSSSVRVEAPMIANALHDIADELFSDLCEGDGQHSEALDKALILKHLRRVLATVREDPEPPFMDDATGKGWFVSVGRWGDAILTISERELAGKPDLTDEDAALIRGAARHLLSFIGEGRAPEPQKDYPSKNWKEALDKYEARAPHEPPAASRSDEYYLSMAALDRYPIEDGLPKSTSVVFRIHQLGHALEKAQEARPAPPIDWLNRDYLVPIERFIRRSRVKPTEGQIEFMLKRLQELRDKLLPAPPAAHAAPTE